jgi:hypothetical protein
MTGKRNSGCLCLQLSECGRVVRRACGGTITLVASLAAMCAPASGSVVHEFEGAFNEGPNGPMELKVGAAVDNSSGASSTDVYVGTIAGAGEGEGEGTIYKFAAAGKYAGVTIQGTGTPAGSLPLANGIGSPTGGIAVDGSAGAGKGNVYVADVVHNVVDRFSEAGVYQCQITGEGVASGSECDGSAQGATPSFTPTGIAVGSNGDLYVANPSAKAIDKFGPSGELLGAIAGAAITHPTMIAVGSNGDLYVLNGGGLDVAGTEVVRLAEAGVLTSTLGTPNPIGLATDPADGHVYVVEQKNEETSRIWEFDAQAHQLDIVGSEHLEFGQLSLAVNATSGRLYASTLIIGGVVMFSGDQIIPNATTNAATNVTASSAALNGEVDPAGGGDITSCQFEYGTSTSYGNTASCSPAPPYTSATRVSADIGGLTGSTTYHFRVSAQNAQVNMAGFSDDQTLRTTGPPAVEFQTEISGPHSAAVKASINPNGERTSCLLHYVSETEYAASGFATATTVPCTPSEVLPSAGTQNVIGRLSRLSINTTYHYQFLARNESGQSPPLEGTIATFGIADFSVGLLDAGGGAYTQAGGHPYALTTNIVLTQTPDGNGIFTPSGNAKDIGVHLPNGMIGNPQATDRCTRRESEEKKCSGAAQVGVIVVHTALLQGVLEAPLFNLVPRKGVAAEFGARLNNFANAFIASSVRTGEGYGISADSMQITGLEAVTSAAVTIWGVPGEASHDSERSCPFERPGAGSGEYKKPCEERDGERPFLRTPTSCPGGMLTSTVLADTYQAPGDYVSKEAQTAGMQGCERLQFAPSLAVTPEASSVDSPMGLEVKLHVPQEESAAGLAEADLKNAAVTLPAGVAINPAAAGGLASCSAAQIELNGPEPASCPGASQIGSVELETPLFPQRVFRGGVYVAAQGENPFGSLLAIYIAIDEPETGVVVKLAGHVEAGENGLQAEQLRTSFDENPQLPFEDLRLKLFGGPRSALSSPQSCGSYTATSALAPWSGNAAAEPFSTFQITGGPGGSACGAQGFAPSFTAGTANNQAGGYSPLTVTLSRHDGEQRLGGVSVTTPPGVSGILKSVARCPEPLASKGECGPDSEIGETTATVGVGPDPYTVTGGKVYLTGPYNGGPFGLSIVVPTVAGPFTLTGNGGRGREIVRASIRVDPHTAQITTLSDPLPSVLEGIPLQIRTVNVTINRPGFTFNPTNCAAMNAGGTITSTAGASATVSSPFQAANCANLPFRPSFTVSTQAKTSKPNGASLDVKVAQKPGEADIHKVDVSLPLALPSRLTTLQKACAGAQFAANPAGCPAGSLVGTATAHTPVLNAPLTGPAYLVSHGGAAFPDLVVVLQGEGIKIELVGNTDIKKGVTFSRFETVPDAPISSFELNLPEGPHSALAAFGDLCTQNLVMPTTIVGQNGAQVAQSTKIAVGGCPLTVNIKKARVKDNAVLLTVTTTQKAILTISGRGLKTTRRTLGAGTHVVKAPLTRAGQAARKGHKKIRIKVSAKNAQGATGKTTSVRL